MPPNRRLRRAIARLERAGNDDFQLILTGGAAAFATHELHLLLRRLQVGTRRVRRLRRDMSRVKLVLPALLLSAGIAARIGENAWMRYALLGALLCVLILIYQNRRAGRSFRSGERVKRLRGIIRQELARRRGGS